MSRCSHNLAPFGSVVLDCIYCLGLSPFVPDLANLVEGLSSFVPDLANLVDLVDLVLLGASSFSVASQKGTMR